MSTRLLTLVSLAGLMLAACSGGAGATVAPTAGAASPSGLAATRFEVTLTDALEMEPASMTVPVGVPVTFVVTNAGSTEHEFYLGDETAQTAHQQEMLSGGMLHDEPDGISLAAGETKELTHTFDVAGETLAGCHVDGHYAAGMKATVTVTG